MVLNGTECTLNLQFGGSEPTFLNRFKQFKWHFSSFEGQRCLQSCSQSLGLSRKVKIMTGMAISALCLFFYAVLVAVVANQQALLALHHFVSSNLRHCSGAQSNNAHDRRCLSSTGEDLLIP